MSSLTPIRRVVAGRDAQGRSKVQWDGPAPNSHEASLGSGRGHTGLWVWQETPLPINGASDDGNLPYVFSGSIGGTPEQFAAFFAAETKRWAPIVTASGARAD